MKRLLLIAISIVSLIGVVGPAPAVFAHKDNEHYTVNLGARGPECQTEGYVAPQEIEVPQGKVTVDFVNQQPTKLEVQGIPGGTFLVKGNSTVEKEFTAGGDLTFTTWLETQGCKKATGHIKVNPAGTQGGAIVWLFVIIAIGAGLYAFTRMRGQGKKSSRSEPKDTPGH